MCIKDCGQEFDNQEAFREHLKEAHLSTTTTDHELGEIVKKCEQRKPLPEGQTTVCPLCREMIPETRKSIRRHLGRHMEEISLSVVPTENYNLEWEESSEDGSVSSSEEGLEMIGEETEGPEQAGSLSQEIRSRSDLLILTRSWGCITDSTHAITKLLRLYDEPQWRREVFALAQAYDANGESQGIAIDDLCLDTRKLIETLPDIAEMRSECDSPEEYNLFLQETVYNHVRSQVQNLEFTQYESVPLNS
jgi:hypothetical protein